MTNNYPDGSDTARAPWNGSDADVQESRCAICDRLCVSDDEGCTWKDDATARYMNADKTPNGRFVCSTACSSQAMYEAATEEERAALRLLAQWNESTLVLRNAFLSFNPYQKRIDIKHASVWERWNNSYDILKLYQMVEKIGAELTGDEEAPAWYSDALQPQAERKPVQSVQMASSARSAAGSSR